MKHKNRRHVEILEIIKNNDIETQDELTQKLIAKGITATQATISRDIKELHLVKVLQKNNKYRYEQRSSPAQSENSLTPSKTVGILNSSVLSMNFAQNIVVVKCYAGMANAACAALDAIGRPEILGTIAGDDTIFIATESTETAQSLLLAITNMMNQ